ncbi:MAG TPA: PHP domain-containing protein [Longimicrobiales bacterium]
MATPPALRIELHCHTVASSDGHITFDGLVRTAKRRGIDAVAITDHDTIDGAIEFRRHARSRNVAIEFIVGEERTLRDGSHLIGLFLREPIRADTLDDAVREIAAQGGIAVLPHPFRRRDGVFRDGLSRDVSAAFEIFNPKCSHEENSRARQLVGSGMAVVGGSDAHFEAELGECVNLVAFETDVGTSVRRALERPGRVRVLGVPQRPGASGRNHAPLYYRLKPYVRVPRPLVPAASRAYRAYLNAIAKRTVGPLEEKYAADEAGD